MGKRRVGGGRPPGQKKPSLTHFLCVPLVNSTSRPQLEASLKLFKNQVSPSASETNPAVEKTAENAGHGGDVVLPHVHRKAIRPIGTLHCTLGVMSLDKDQLAEAISLLQGIDIQAMVKETTITSPTHTDGSTSPVPSLEKPITPPELQRPQGPFKVDLKGLVSMHAAKSTSVLYTAPSDETGRLLPFCIALQKLFKDKGFITDDRSLKLHATIVNTIYAKGRNRPPRSNAYQSKFSQAGEAGASAQEAAATGHGPNANTPLKIDATALAEKYKDFVWAKDVVLDRVAICEMGAKKITDEDENVVDEEYTEVASIELPV